MGLHWLSIWTITNQIPTILYLRLRNCQYKKVQYKDALGSKQELKNDRGRPSQTWLDSIAVSIFVDILVELTNFCSKSNNIYNI